MAAKKHAGGRPSTYSVEMADILCARIAKGESLLKICASDGLPDDSTVYRWLDAHEEFRDKYARAREIQADFYAAQCIEIADDGSNDTYTSDNGEQVNHDVIARSRLRVDARKWYASKLAPKKYGDKIEQTINADVTVLTDEQRRERLAELLAKASVNNLAVSAKSPNKRDEK